MRQGFTGLQGVGIGQDKTMQGGSEDLILWTRPTHCHLVCVCVNFKIDILA